MTLGQGEESMSQSGQQQQQQGQQPASGTSSQPAEPKTAGVPLSDFVLQLEDYAPTVRKEHMAWILNGVPAEFPIRKAGARVTSDSWITSSCWSICDIFDLSTMILCCWCCLCHCHGNSKTGLTFNFWWYPIKKHVDIDVEFIWQIIWVMSSTAKCKQ